MDSLTIQQDGSDSIEASQVNARKQLVNGYASPQMIDTFYSGNGKQYHIVFKHYCTMDSSLMVPAKYNFDIKKDFVTHNYKSDLTLYVNGITAFARNVSKESFMPYVDAPIKKYGALLYPRLSVQNDSIKIAYSYSIPVTDIGMPVTIMFADDGNYSVAGK